MTTLRFKVAPVWKGTYSDSTPYDISDEVKDPNGSGNYRSLVDNNVGNDLTDTTKWIKILDLSELKTAVDNAIAINATANANEDTRINSELIREANEDTRKDNELARVAHENIRTSNETNRQDAESNRSASEITRKNNETGRVNAEQIRAASEVTRVNNENSRVSAESSRASAETLRSNAESTRSSNESTRVSNESTRQSNESTRQSNETTRQTNEGSSTDTASATGSRWARYKKAEADRNISFNAEEGANTDTASASGSRWARFKDAEATRQTTFETNEGTSDDEASASGSRWARYKAEEASRSVAITLLDTRLTAVENNKANIDGFYTNMGVGGALNIIKSVSNENTELLRQTGGISNEVGNGLINISAIKGHSVVWNQLVRNGNFANGTTNWNGITSVSDGVASAVKAATNTPTLHNIIQQITYTLNHKYLFTFYVKSDNSATQVSLLPISTSSEGMTEYIYYADFTKVGWIWSSSVNDSRNLAIRGYNLTDPTQDVAFSVKNVGIIDLTLIFGAGNEPTTVAQFETWLATNVGLKPYYGYDGGSILNAKMTGLHNTTQNLLNPTTRKARLITYTYGNNSNKYTIKNVPDGATILFTPDNTGVAEAIIPDSNGIFTITSVGTLELSVATLDTYLCMTWDNTKDDDVVEFADYTKPFDVTKVYGQLDGAGDYVQVYPNGMLNADNSKDTLYVDNGVIKAVVNVGDVDLGTLTGWTYYSNYGGYFIINNLNVGQKLSRTSCQLISNKYGKSDWSNMLNESNTNCVCLGDNRQANGGLILKDYSLLSTDIVNNQIPKLSGVMLNYELATPLIYTNLVYRDNGIDIPLKDVFPSAINVDNWATEEILISAYSNDSPTSCVPTVVVKYSLDAGEWIDSANNGAFISYESMIDALEKLGAILGFTVSEPTFSNEKLDWTGCFAVTEPTPETDE